MGDGKNQSVFPRKSEYCDSLFEFPDLIIESFNMLGDYECVIENEFGGRIVSKKILLSKLQGELSYVIDLLILRSGQYGKLNNSIRLDLLATGARKPEKYCPLFLSDVKMAGFIHCFINIFGKEKAKKCTEFYPLLFEKNTKVLLNMYTHNAK